MPKPKIKSYPHFDPMIPEAAALRLASNPERVAKHAFYPFLHFDRRWTKRAEKGKLGEKKNRPIRYAARRDAYIFSHYRVLLNENYEAALKDLGLDEEVIAYRPIPSGIGKGNKCNIHFALDAFRKIAEIGDCYVFTFDISKFFENLDHEQLRKVWARLLRVTRLPDDHFQVFKAVTKYAWIDKTKAYEKLGLIGEKTAPDGKKKVGYKVAKSKFPKRLCSAKDFREKLASEIEQNKEPFGIPQGSPISDVLANLYLIDFDLEMQNYVRSHAGYYRRYSDDILLILPKTDAPYKDTVHAVRAALLANGPRLEIKASKTQVYSFTKRSDGAGQDFVLLDGAHGKNGLEYLGFRFSGVTAYLRDSTISSVHRKITAAAKSMARRHVEKHPGLSASELVQKFNFGLLAEKFGKVRDFEKFASEYRKWTFWTYAKRSSEIFGPWGAQIARQMRNYRHFVRSKATKAIEDVLHNPKAKSLLNSSLAQ